MDDRDLLKLAAQLCSLAELEVWLTKHIAGKGRRTGSIALGISEDAWRYRLRRAEDKLAPHIKEAQP